MLYKVLDRFTVKTSQGERVINPGQIIKLDESKAKTLGDKVRPCYRIIYYDIIDDSFLLVDTEKEAEALRSSGIIDVIYTAKEIIELRGLDGASLKAHHRIKKVFPQSVIEQG